MSADEIAKLAQLKEKGLLTDAEFTARKAQLLGMPGSQTAPVSMTQTAGQALAKSRGTAIVLSLIPGGLWTWLYTFKRDKVKFFIGIALLAITGGIRGAGGPNINVLIWIGLWIWAFVEALIRKPDFYENFPNG